MTRSYRHTPVCGITKARSDRDWKRMWHRGLRHTNRQRVRLGHDALHVRAYVKGNIYRSPKDGKQRMWPGQPRHWGGSSDEWQALYSRLMRK